MAIRDYRIELRPKATDVTNIVALFAPSSDKPLVIPPVWSFLRRGGCENLSFGVAAKLEDIPAAGYANHDCRVVIDTGTGPRVWWRGYITDSRPALGQPDIANFSAAGYTRRLDHLPVVGLGFPIEGQAAVWTNVDVATIATDLVDFLKAWVPVTYSGTSAPASGFVTPQEELTGDITSALKVLAEIAGDSDWGIGLNLEFHFRPKSTVLGDVFVLGSNVVLLEKSVTTAGMVNRIYLFGGDDTRFVINVSSSVVDDQSQIIDNTVVAFGKATNNQRLFQSFVPTKGTMSDLQIKLNHIGFTTNNKATDGNMELVSDVSNWLKLKTRTVRAKDTTYKHSDAQSLKITHDSTGKGKYGCYQDMTVTAARILNVSLYVSPTTSGETGGITVELIDGTAATIGSGSVLASAVTIPLVAWQRLSFQVTPSGVTLGLRFFGDNQIGGTGGDPFWVDDVLVTETADVIVELYEWVTSFTADGKPIAQAVINFADIAADPAVSGHTVLLTAMLRTNRGYGFVVSSDSTLSDTQYFQLRINSAGGYGSGALQRYDGSTWPLVTGDAYFRIRLPTPQATYGVWGEVVNNPQIFDTATAAQWGTAVLASRQAPITRARFRVVDYQGLVPFEDVMPLRKIRVQGVTDDLPVERLIYAIGAQGGLSLEVELGQKLPREADLLAWIEHRIARAEASR